MFDNKNIVMRIHILIGLFFSTYLTLFAQTDNKPKQATPSRVIVKEGVKMYELKIDGNSGVVIIDPKNDGKEAKQNSTITPTQKDTTNKKY